VNNRLGKPLRFTVIASLKMAAWEVYVCMMFSCSVSSLPLLDLKRQRCAMRNIQLLGMNTIILTMFVFAQKATSYRYPIQRLFLLSLLENAKLTPIVDRLEYVSF
jgi:hypothetical protein